ncbi:hypothetical protein FACS1894122_06500 [Alphaproteobacteria bacterium]|nr:hypothetical protein FACS1894122_06500 [Alphaproteobacteria bacterium]
MSCNNIVVAMDPAQEERQRIDGCVTAWLLQNNIANLRTEEQIIAVADQIIPDVLKVVGVTDSIAWFFPRGAY